MGQLGLEWKQEDVVNNPELEIRKASKLMLEVHIAFSLLDPSDIIQAHEFENNNGWYMYPYPFLSTNQLNRLPLPSLSFLDNIA